MNKQYIENIRHLLSQLESTQEKTIEEVSAVCADAILQGGLLYFFGTGHSHMICEEPFYRAGGLACIYPILESDLMLHRGASKSSAYERIQDLGTVVVSHTPIGKGDVLFLVSNSGRNAVIVDAALEAKRLGAVTVAITSMNHTTNVESRHREGKKLYEVCDYVLDNGGIFGDASVALEGLPQRIAPTSSILDITLVNLVIINTTEILLANGMVPPVFTSANTDVGDVSNKSILEEFRQKVPTL